MPWKWFTCLVFFAPVLYAEPTSYERSVLAEMNKARVEPKSLVPRLKQLLRQIDGKFLYLTPTSRIETVEGNAPIVEAIKVLGELAPRAPFEYSDELSMAARDHAREQARTGATGHFSENGDGPTERAKQYVKFIGKSGENVSYGEYGGKGAVSVVVAFVVDDGVPDRGHRKVLFEPDFRQVGIACGPHPKYSSLCVVDFAQDLKKSLGRK